MALLASEIHFKIERENIMYESIGNETVTVHSDLSLAAALEEMALKGARHFGFAIQEYFKVDCQALVAQS